MGVFLDPHLDEALQAWADEVASAKDPGLRDHPLRWTFFLRTIKGYPPHDCPNEQKSARLTRWAETLNLVLKPAQSPHEVGILTYVGEVQGWPVTLNVTVDEAARNRALLEAGSMR
ncbi:hypothetical protein [Amycolatopsis sp. NBC_01480]|uniref:hypothetical protein n=1 Tax=Amycolatopsis sp. NBC_01480 TaxID=2903562 RepID=UPI002E296A3D|nr:hypothetical protein [Amycolatopsis sp. NBC_01480]